MKTIVRIFKALSDQNRIRILKMLQSRPLCVCEITSILGLATSTVSKHLSILKTSGLISDRKDAKWVNYEIDLNSGDPEVDRVLRLMRGMLEKDEVIRTDRKKVTTVDRNRICSTESS
ncbi:winged helix-turn-helix transcriptional regulator [bacterium]|nr:winged helix-turn-helix transcriptional regulator [bacterium]